MHPKEKTLVPGRLRRQVEVSSISHNFMVASFLSALAPASSQKRTKKAGAEVSMADLAQKWLLNPAKDPTVLQVRSCLHVERGEDALLRGYNPLKTFHQPCWAQVPTPAK